MCKRKTPLQSWTVMALAAVVFGAIGLATPASADTAADGSATTTDDLISSTTPDTLVTVTTTGLNPNHTHICVVNASAEAAFVANGTWIFGISLDGAAPTAASERRIEMFNNSGIQDDSFEEVSTTIAFANLTGDHTFRFSARKASASSGNLNVTASSITVVCTAKDV